MEMAWTGSHKNRRSQDDVAPTLCLIRRQHAKRAEIGAAPAPLHSSAWSPCCRCLAACIRPLWWTAAAQHLQSTPNNGTSQLVPLTIHRYPCSCSHVARLFKAKHSNVTVQGRTHMKHIFDCSDRLPGQ